MTQPRDIERLLDQWFADGSSVAPDRIIDIVADRIERQPQRPAWRLDWRHLTMNPLAKAGVAIAAVVLIAFVGYNLLPGRSTGVGGPAPSASPTAVPTPTPSATAAPSTGNPVARRRCFRRGTRRPSTAAEPGSCAGSQRPACRPALTFTVPAGWVNSVRCDLLGLFPDTPANQAEALAPARPSTGTLHGDLMPARISTCEGRRARSGTTADDRSPPPRPDEAPRRSPMRSTSRSAASPASASTSRTDPDWDGSVPRVTRREPDLCGTAAHRAVPASRRPRSRRARDLHRLVDTPADHEAVLAQAMPIVESSTSSLVVASRTAREPRPEVPALLDFQRFRRRSLPRLSDDVPDERHER